MAIKRFARLRAGDRRRRNPISAGERLEPRLALSAVGFGEELAGPTTGGTLLPAPLPAIAQPFAGPAPTPVAAAFLRAAALDGFTAADIDSATEWVVRLAPGSDATAAALAAGARNSRPTGILADTHVWTFPEAAAGAGGRRLVTADRPRSVVAAYPLVAREQAKRLIPDDPLFANQWHLLNTGQGGGTVGEDANVSGVWETYLGTGVLIAIVDDGLQRTHPDLAARYVASASFDFNGNDPDPTPVGNDAHGTAAAGVAAGSGNNGLGISGAAPGASLAGLRLIAAPVTDAQEATALTYALAEVDISSNSWGPNDTGQQLAGPGPLTLAALERGVTDGRDGRGIIYVWAAGNGLQNDDNVNYDGYANSRYTIAVTAIDNTGVQSWYAEPGAPILVAAHSNGGTLGITTTDLVGTAGYNTASSGAGGDYTNTFGGTSSATPLVSGIVALMLEANPELTWRDVQHVLVDSARRNDPSDADWTQNGAGRWVNHKYGYGAVDAAAAVALAETWISVAPESTVGSGTQTVGQTIPDNDATGISSTFTMSADLTTEWVEVTFAATHSYRGDLEVVLTSPSGTRSVLAESRDDPGENYTSWTFTSARHWGESSAGDWTLTVRDRVAADVGTWTSWSLAVYGTEPVVAEPPTLAITADTPGPVLAGGSATITFTVDQPVSGFTLDDVAVTGGTLSGFGGSGGSYTATFTPQPGFEGTAVLSVAAGAFTNAADLGNEAAELTLPVDAARPTVVIARAGGGTLTAGATATITFTVSEPGTTFGSGAVSVTGGTLSGFAGAGTTFTALFTPQPGFEGTATITVAGGAFADAAGNANESATLTLPVDTLPPTVVVTRAGVGPLAIGATATITFTVSEPGTTFGSGAVSVTGGVLSGFTGVGTISTAVFTPQAGFEGTATITVAGGAFVDAAGQGNAAALLAIPVDTIAPTVAITAGGDPLLTIGESGLVVFSFSEPPAGFGLTAVVVTGGVLTDLNGAGLEFSATFLPAADFRGTATITLPAFGVTDPAGNGNPAGATVSFPVDTVAPLIVGFSSPAAGGTLGIGASALIVATFSEPVSAGGVVTVRLSSGVSIGLVVDSDGLTARGLYTVQPGEVAAPLEVTAILDDGGLRNAVGNRLATGLPPGGAGLSGRGPIVVDGAVKFVARGGFSTDPDLVRDLKVPQRQIPLRFTTPVQGVTLAGLRLSVDGRPVPLQAARLLGGGDSYVLLLPLTRVRPIGVYTLTIAPGAAVRAVANGASASTAVGLRWGYGSSVGMVPDAPDAVVATSAPPVRGRGAARVAWDVARANAGGAITGYVVEYRPAGSSRWLRVREPVAAGAEPAVKISGLARGRSYEFRVAARNPAGLGRFSTPAVLVVA